MENDSVEEQRKFHGRRWNHWRDEYDLTTNSKYCQHGKSTNFWKLNSIKKYWFLDIAVKAVLQSEYFQNKEDDSNNSSDRDPKFHIKVQKSIDLTSSIEVTLDKRIVPIEEYKLLEKKWRSNLRFFIKTWIPRVCKGLGWGYLSVG